MRSLSYSVMITDIDIACTKLQSLGQFFNSRALLCLNLTFCSDFSAKRPPEASIQMFYVICLGAWGLWLPLSDFIHCVSTLLWPKCDSISTENNHLSWLMGQPYLNPVSLFALLSALCPHQGLKPQSFRNPYDIPRSHLLDQLSRMRRNLLNTSVCNLRGQDSGKSVCLPLSLFGHECAVSIQ